jgi:hypothetical protein
MTLNKFTFAALGLTLVLVLVFGGIWLAGKNPQSSTETAPAVVIAPSVPETEWQTVELPLYSISLPPGWKSYEYTNPDSIGLCPIESCHDARVWVELVYSSTVSNELAKARDTLAKAEVQSKSFPITIAGHEATGIGIPRTGQTDAKPHQTFIQQGDNVLSIGFDGNLPLHQQIISTLVIK